MELDELKDLLKEDNKKLEARILINEKLLGKMNLDKAVGEFDRLIKRSILGRNLALLYCTISLLLSLIVIKDLQYSIPGIIGGLAMLWSFIGHSAIRKPDFYKISLIDLQKTICQFRIHTSSSARSDISVTLLWLLTLIPLYIRVAFHFRIYSHPFYLSVFCIVYLIIILLTVYFSVNIYKEYDRKLKETELYMNEIIEFEKE